MCLRWSALRIGQGNVANTYQLIGMCYVLLIVSGKKYRVRHIHVSPRWLQARRYGIDTYGVIFTEMGGVDIGGLLREDQE